MLRRYRRGRGGEGAVWGGGGSGVTKTILATLTIAMLTPVTARAAVVVEPAQTAGASTDSFSLAALVDGTDHVLASVDDRVHIPPDPLGDGAVAFPGSGVPASNTIRSTGSDATYGSANDAGREPLPEPATWLMMILGFFGLSFAVRRRSAATGDRVRFS